MRYIRIFLLYFQDALQYRSTSFVWFLLALINPLMVLLFWRGAFVGGGNPLSGWTFSSVVSYYFLLIIAGSLFMVHIEDEVARQDIQLGGLSRYLTRPFPYILLKFFAELPWRLIQGIFGIIVLGGFIVYFGRFISISQEPMTLGLAIIIAIFGYLLSFIFKMILGLSALWVTDYGGLQQLVEIIIIIFAGFIMPLDLFPSFIRNIAMSLPFAYMIYFPIVAFLGELSRESLLQVIGVEFFWFIVLVSVYSLMWKNGVKKFTGLGQ